MQTSHVIIWNNSNLHWCRICAWLQLYFCVCVCEYFLISLRLSWQQTVLTFSTRHFFDQAALTGRSSSLLPMKRWNWIDKCFQLYLDNEKQILLTSLHVDRNRDLIMFGCPLQARLDILKIHSRKMNLTRGINLRKIAELMPGASGAEVKVRSWFNLRSCFHLHSLTGFTSGGAAASVWVFYVCVSDRASAQRQGCTPWERGGSTLPRRTLKWQ